MQNSKNELIQEISALIGTENDKYSSNVYKALIERKSKEGVHNYLMKELHDNKKVTELYKKIKPLLKEKSWFIIKSERVKHHSSRYRL